MFSSVKKDFGLQHLCCRLISFPSLTLILLIETKKIVRMSLLGSTGKQISKHKSYGGKTMAEEKKVEVAAKPAEVKKEVKKAAAKKPAAKKTAPAKKAAAKKHAAKKAVPAKKTVAKRAPAKKVKKLGKVIFEIEGKQIDYKAIEKKAAKLGGDVYVVVGEKKIFDADGKSVDLF